MNGRINNFGPLTWDKCVALLGRRDKRNVCHETTLHWRTPYNQKPHIALKLFNTDIVSFYQDGSYLVDTGGWNTSTTSQRLHEALGFNVYFAERGDWWFFPEDEAMPLMPLTGYSIALNANKKASLPIGFSREAMLAILARVPKQMSRRTTIARWAWDEYERTVNVADERLAA